jgi:hypothetical protein
MPAMRTVASWRFGTATRSAASTADVMRNDEGPDPNGPEPFVVG